MLASQAQRACTERGGSRVAPAHVLMCVQVGVGPHFAADLRGQDDRSYRGADRPARGVQANGERFYSYEAMDGAQLLTLARMRWPLKEAQSGTGV